MSDTDYPRLAQLMSAYFHQDWCDDHDSESAVLEDFVQSTWQDEVMRTIADIERYLSDHTTALPSAFERDFAPMISIGDTDPIARAWLANTRDQLHALIDQAPVRPT